jgi:hypothetical protein
MAREATVAEGSARKLIDGVKVRMGGEEYILPPINLAALKRLKAQFKCLETLSPTMGPGDWTDEQVDAMITVIHSALSRNYPEITVEQLAEIIDMGSIQKVFPALAGVSGLEQGEAAPQPTENGKSTGASSTA